jgi:hypothetical protein
MKNWRKKLVFAAFVLVVAGSYFVSSADSVPRNVYTNAVSFHSDPGGG